MVGPRGEMSPDFGDLGKKVDYPAPEADEWVQHGDNPHIERNTKTGRLRNVEPPPKAKQWVYVPPLPVPDVTEVP